jgi:hypothetical protein
VSRSSEAPLYRTLQLDRRNERAVAWLRLIAGIVVLGCAAWIISTSPDWKALLLAILGLLGGAFWVTSFVRARARLRKATQHSLAIEADGLTLTEGDRVTHLSWTEVRTIEVDEDRLAVRIEKESGALELEPRYEGVGLYELRGALHDAWKRAQS